MSDFGKFIGGFGESFVKTLESDRKRRKEENEFNQQMAYKYRQQNLMNIHYQEQEKRLQESEAREKDLQELGVRSQYQEISPEPNMPLLPIMMGGVAGGERNKNFDALKPFQEGKFYAPKQEKGKNNFEFKSKYNPKRGVNEIFWVDKNNPNAEPKYYGDEKPDKTGSGGDGDKGVFFDVSKSNDLLNEYSRFGKDNLIRSDDGATYWLKDEGYTRTGDKLTPKTFYTPEQIKAKKGTLMKKIETETNEEARKIGEKVKGFYSLYQAAINEMVKTKRTDVDSYVNENYGDVRAEIREILKTQLKKRIF